MGCPHDDLLLQQAFETLHAPDAAAVMAGSAVDAMLKHFDLTEGSVYKRIDQAVTQQILTLPMAEWAHMVRLESNRPRHADTENPHVSPQQAAQSVDHRIAMSIALVGLRVPGVTILDPGCVGKTYPNYSRDLASLGVMLAKPD
jgi:hypothetical protein